MPGRAGLFGTAVRAEEAGITAVTQVGGAIPRTATTPTSTTVTMSAGYSTSRWLVVVYSRHCGTQDPDLTLTMDTVLQTRLDYVGDLTIDVWAGVWICQPTGATTSLAFGFSDTGLNVGGVTAVEVIRSGTPTLVDLAISASTGAAVSANTTSGGAAFAHAIQSSSTAPGGDFTTYQAGSTAGWFLHRSSPHLYPTSGSPVSMDPVTNSATVWSVV